MHLQLRLRQRHWRLGTFDQEPRLAACHLEEHWWMVHLIPAERIETFIKNMKTKVYIYIQEEQFVMIKNEITYSFSERCANLT